jgi:hypothetical protein
MRALKVLSEREVTPQLGLLKSTLLQLDSTFSERNYGAGSFRDFMEKVAQEGAVTLKHAGRSMLVEATEDGRVHADVTPAADRPRPTPVAPVAQPAAPMGGNRMDGAPPSDDTDEEESLPQSPMSMQDGIKTVQRAFTQSATPPRWPMYVRQAKQFLRTVVEDFDERKYGFASLVDLLRAAGREGVVRIERDRQGAVRVFPGQQMDARGMSSPVIVGLPIDDPEDENAEVDAAVEAAGATDVTGAEMPGVVEIVEEAAILEAQPIEVESGAEGATVAGATADPDVQSEDEDEHLEDEVDGNRDGPPVRTAARKRRAPTARAAKTTARAPKARAAARPRSRKTTRS